MNIAKFLIPPVYLWQNLLGPWLNPKGISENVKGNREKIEDQSLALDKCTPNG
jgi:hypothetical protein